MAQVVVVGSINVDYVVRIGHLPRPGETVANGELSIRPGGKGANQAHAAASLGASVVMIGAVGNDEAGRAEWDALDAAGVDTGGLRRCAEPTGLAMIFVDGAGENMIAVAPGANRRLTSEVVTARLSGHLDDSSVVLASLEVPLDAVAAAVATARDASATVIINPAPAMPLPAELVTGAILTPNEGELRRLAPGAAGEEEAIAALLGAGAAAVIVTRGARGASLFEPGKPGFHLPAPQVAVVDTVGAGDAFNAGLAVALAEGQPLRSSLRYAVAAGAVACTGAGARGALPTEAGIEELLHNSS